MGISTTRRTGPGRPSCWCRGSAASAATGRRTSPPSRNGIRSSFTISSRSRIRYSVDQMTDDLLGVMDHLEIDKAHLIGHSTGGAIGQTLAARQSKRLLSLTIYASWTKADPFFRRV